MELNKIQKATLNRLIDTYESSATYKGSNTKNQRFALKPEKVFPDYNSDYADQDEVDQFNRDMELLKDKGFVYVEYMKGMPVIEKIVLNVDFLDCVYTVIKREDITKKRNKERLVYESYKGKHPILDSFCNKQIERLEKHKDAIYTIDVASHILELLDEILRNNSYIMERELSIKVFGNTKRFEDSYKKRICKIIEEYDEVDYSCFEKNEKEKVILEEYQVYANPSYVFFKGDVEIVYQDGMVMTNYADKPIAISSEIIEEIVTININSPKIVTVENLTSYHRMQDPEATFIFLSGYHNTAKQRFLKRIAECNADKLWYHFGDIDSDGYYILKNLVEKIGISFEPLWMGVEELQKYARYCKPLEANDLVKVKSLIDLRFYEEVMQFMMDNNCKLEQEIISWMNNKNISGHNKQS